MTNAQMDTALRIIEATEAALFQARCRAAITRAHRHIRWLERRRRRK